MTSGRGEETADGGIDPALEAAAFLFLRAPRLLRLAPLAEASRVQLPS